MIDFEAVEKRIVDLLSPLRDRGILARLAPDESGKVGFQVQGPGVVNVVVDAVGKGDHASLDMRVQKRVYTVTCEMWLQRRRGVSGLGQVAAHLEQLLHGARIEGLGPLEFSSYKELGRTESHWVAQVSFTCTRVDRQ